MNFMIEKFLMIVVVKKLNLLASLNRFNKKKTDMLIVTI